MAVRFEDLSSDKGTQSASTPARPASLSDSARVAEALRIYREAQAAINRVAENGSKLPVATMAHAADEMARVLAGNVQATGSRVPSPAEVEAGKTDKGGYDYATLARWGVELPPKKGWRQQLARQYREQQSRV